MSAITYYRNDTVAIKVTLRNKSDLSPIDLTGKALTLTVDPSEDPADALGNLMQLTGVIVGAATDGVATFTPVGADSDFAPGNYYFDIQIVNSGDGLEKQTVVKDRFYHKQDITK